MRNIFGLSKDEIWEQLCSEIGGEFVKGRVWNGGSKVRVQVREWVVTLDSFNAKVDFTRIRAPYVNKDGFRFKIYRKSFFSRLGKLCGMQDIEVGGPKFEKLEPLFGIASYLRTEDIECGYPEFDQEFIIKGNNRNKVQELFKNLKIRELIQAQPSIYLAVKDDEGWFGERFPAGVDELYFQVEGIIKDISRLKSLFELFAEVLNMLCHIGSAYENDPKIKL
ncbi:MAG: DUF3137 domain-containing protein [Acidobacteriota bacterium]